MFAFMAKHRGIWPLKTICGALGVSRSGFYGRLCDELLTTSSGHRHSGLS